MAASPWTLRFGVPTLDDLFGDPAERAGDAERPATTSVCIIGPDGTGKSILGLHLAAHYAADSRDPVSVVYASTDLSYESARGSWYRFALHRPNGRRVPFEEDDRRRGAGCRSDAPLLALKEAIPFNAAAGVLNRLWCEGERDVLFLDLQSATAGDDWGFLNRLLASLPAPGAAWPHLLVIDAVEGLETFVGDRDAYGERRTRRSRVAQILRTAAHKSHVVFIVEQPRDEQRLPEEFVTDRVIRMRHVLERGYLRRTLEVVKARGQDHVRGQHLCLIRDGRGSKTGFQENPDDPTVPYSASHPPQAERYLVAPKPEAYVQSYIHICHSIHRRTRVEMEADTGPRNQVPGRVGFGIDQLDNMFADHDLRARDPRPPEKPEAKGPPAGQALALIGDHGTHKSWLGRHFLGGCFIEREHWGVAVLLTNHDVRHDELARTLACLAGCGGDADAVARRVICRRLETHDISSPVFAHILDELVNQARVLNGREESWRIRLVIDDWAVIRATHRELSSDPLLLPFLVQYLNRAQISTLFIETQSGSPGVQVDDPIDGTFRALLEQHVYVWHVPFFGERRTAVSVSPGGAGRRLLVRELKASERDRERLDVDPHFELYMGLEEGAPRLTPLEVRFYGETPALLDYVGRVDSFLQEVFVPLPRRSGIIVTEKREDYDRLHELCRLQTDARLGHTLVFQVDEYWAQDGWNGLADLTGYLDAVTTRNEEPDLTLDPFLVFQSASREARARHTYYSFRGYRGAQSPDGVPHPTDRAPYAWDFGFLLLKGGAWEQAAAKNVGNVAAVWHALVKAPIEPSVAALGSGVPGWRRFLEACRDVARAQAARGDAHPTVLDIGGRVPESLACLVLEIWASEICLSLRGSPRALQDFQRSLSTRSRKVDEGSTGEGLLPWLKADRPPRKESDWKSYRWELYLALIILSEALRDTDFPLRELARDQEGPPVTQAAIAARHWYSSATKMMAEFDPADPFVAARLPGHFSVRGDWSLAMARGSRSNRLGLRVLDLLSDRRANSARLRGGFGLPTRSLVQDDQNGGLATALYGIDKEGRMRSLSYRDMLGIAARDDPHFGDQEAFMWLWRSNLVGYERQTRIWQRWLYATFSWLTQLQRVQGERWMTGFEVYDVLRGHAPSRPGKPINTLDSFAGFNQLCDFLVAELEPPK